MKEMNFGGARGGLWSFRKRQLLRKWGGWRKRPRRKKAPGRGQRWSSKKKKKAERETRHENSWRERGAQIRGDKKCVKESMCSFESSLHVVAGHHSAVRSTFTGQELLVTLMAWKENHVTLSPRHDANMVVAFVSSAPSPLHNSLEVTNWS